MNTDRNANTAAIALAYSSNEEVSALHSTVAWTVHVISQVCGWDGTPIKGGKKTAIKMARERYGYRVDSNGESILDHKGNRAKRSAVFNRLALVDKVIAYALANEKEWVETIHQAAICPESSPEERDQRVSECIEQFADRLATVAGGETIDALKYYLEHGESKPAKVDDPTAALGDDESGEQGEQGEPEGESFDFESLYQTLAANAESVSKAQWKRIHELARDNLMSDGEIDAKAA